MEDEAEVLLVLVGCPRRSPPRPVEEEEEADAEAIEPEVEVMEARSLVALVAFVAGTVTAAEVVGPAGAAPPSVLPSPGMSVGPVYLMVSPPMVSML